MTAAFVVYKTHYNAHILAPNLPNSIMMRTIQAGNLRQKREAFLTPCDPSLRQKQIMLAYYVT
jgi:hypothetical protein